MPKPESHLEIWADSLIVAIPATLAFQWPSIQKNLFGREPNGWERFLVFLFGTALTVYLVYYVLIPMKNKISTNKMKTNDYLWWAIGASTIAILVISIIILVKVEKRSESYVPFLYSSQNSSRCSSARDKYCNCGWPHNCMLARSDYEEKCCKDSSGNPTFCSGNPCQSPGLTLANPCGEM
jgi:hypothetical protein